MLELLLNDETEVRAGNLETRFPNVFRVSTHSQSIDGRVTTKRTVLRIDRSGYRIEKQAYLVQAVSKYLDGETTDTGEIDELLSMVPMSTQEIYSFSRRVGVSDLALRFAAAQLAEVLLDTERVTVQVQGHTYQIAQEGASTAVLRDGKPVSGTLFRAYRNALPQAPSQDLRASVKEYPEVLRQVGIAIEGRAAQFQELRQTLISGGGQGLN